MRCEFYLVVAVDEWQGLGLNALLYLLENLIVLRCASCKLVLFLRALVLLGSHSKLLHDEGLGLSLLRRLGDEEGQRVDPHLLKLFLVLDLGQEAKLFNKLLTRAYLLQRCVQITRHAWLQRIVLLVASFKLRRHEDGPH